MCSSAPFPMKTPTKRSCSCKHRFFCWAHSHSFCLPAVYCLCAIISPLSERLSNRVFTFESNHPYIILIMGLDPLYASTLLLSQLCVVLFAYWSFSKHSPHLIHLRSQRNPLMYGNISLCYKYQSQPATLCLIALLSGRQCFSFSDQVKKRRASRQAHPESFLFSPFYRWTNWDEVYFKGSLSSKRKSFEG